MPGSSSQSANRTRDALARLQSLEQATIIQRERSQTLLSHLLCLRGHQLLPSPPVISMPSMLREHPMVCTCVYVYRLPPLAYTIIWRFCLRTSSHRTTVSLPAAIAMRWSPAAHTAVIHNGITLLPGSCVSWDRGGVRKSTFT